MGRIPRRGAGIPQLSASMSPMWIFSIEPPRPRVLLQADGVVVVVVIRTDHSRC